MSLGAIHTAEASPSGASVHGAMQVHTMPAQKMSRYFRRKAYLDRPLAAALLLIAAPLIAVLWLLVKCSSRGTGFYGQCRVGRGGRTFIMYKLRTMRADAEAGTGVVWSAVSDPRVTRLGSILRKLHLDELPQLYNVVRGDMALVGPRPERPEFVRVLSQKLDNYDRRHTVAPGITGLAQLNLPPDTDLNSVARKLVLDLEYILDATAWLEFRLVLCTFTRIFKLPTIRALGLHRTVDLPEPEVRLAMTPTMIEMASERNHDSAERETSAVESVPAPHTQRAKARQKSHARLT